MLQAVYHLDDMEKWPLALSNLENLLEYCGDRGLAYALELVANGAAVQGLRLADAQAAQTFARLTALSQRRVVLAACQNALRAHQIRREELCGFVTVVPAGVAELAEKQAQGFAYIRP